MTTKSSAYKPLRLSNVQRTKPLQVD